MSTLNSPGPALAPKPEHDASDPKSAATSVSMDMPETSSSTASTMIDGGKEGEGNIHVVVKTGEGSNSSEKDMPVHVDIEHVHVENDPRMWSRSKKYLVLFIVCFSSIGPTFAPGLYNPAFPQLRKDLGASASSISLSVSLFILFQGNTPLFWSPISEIYGRKRVYIISMAILCIGAIVAALADDIMLIIGMRIVQAFGSSAINSMGAGTLADIFDPHERGTIIGIYQAFPTIGPSIGPIIGGLLTSAFDWRATFWCLLVFGAIALFMFAFLFPETFRKERSASYQMAVMRATELAAKKAAAKAEKEGIASDGEKAKDGDSTKKVSVSGDDVKLSFSDVSIFGSIWTVLMVPSNAVTLIASGFIFAFQYAILFTASITFSEAPYGYSPIIIGVILLSFGVGATLGTVIGGRRSDATRMRMKKAFEESQAKHLDPTDDVESGEPEVKMWIPEVRLRNALIVMPIFPAASLAYAWLTQYHVNIAGPVVALFFAGFSLTWMYASILTYVVDANAGRSSTAVAINSSFRGTFAFVFSEISPTILNAIGNGGLYSIWTGLIVILNLLTILVIYKGARWRSQH